MLMLVPLQVPLLARVWFLAVSVSLLRVANCHDILSNLDFVRSIVKQQPPMMSLAVLLLSRVWCLAVSVSLMGVANRHDLAMHGCSCILQPIPLLQFHLAVHEIWVCSVRSSSLILGLCKAARSGKSHASEKLEFWNDSDLMICASLVSPDIYLSFDIGI